MAIDRRDYQLFSSDDFTEIIGESLQDKLADRGIDNAEVYLITYVSQLISSFIQEHTSLNIYKEYNQATPNDYEITLGLAGVKSVDEDTLDVTYEVTYPVELTEDQINMLRLACIYEADYIIANGSTERMSSIGMVNRSNKWSKSDLKEFEVCTMSYTLLANAGLLYQGIGGGLYARIK